MKNLIALKRFLVCSSLIFTCLFSYCVIPSLAQGVDQDTLLLLQFENSLNGEQGETPSSAAGHSFQPGVQGQGVSLPAGNQVLYPAANNVNALEGTIEFWIKPSWNGNDNQSHAVFDWNGGGYGGMRIEKSNINRFEITMDRFRQWKETNVYVNSWQTGQWHHVAFTFSNTTKTQKVYIDGALKNQITFTGDLLPINTANFRIGAYPDGSNAANAVLDQFRISNKARTDQEIYASYNSFTVNSISLSAVTTNLWQTWRIPVIINADTNIGNISIPSSRAVWTSSNPNVAVINSQGEILGVGAGTATLTATVNGAQKSITVNVNAPVLPPRVDIPTGFRATSAANSVYEIPVVSLRYLPTKDGIYIDDAWAPEYYPSAPKLLTTLEKQLDSYDEVEKYMLEEGSRFHGYGSQIPQPSLGYRIVATITVYEPPPPGKVRQITQNFPLYTSEAFQIFERLNIRDYVENQGVKEIWFAKGEVLPDIPSYNPNIHPPENFRFDFESNMASPSTSDISNSNRDNSDLPIYNRTYVLYHRAVRRFDEVSIHGDGHQLEGMLKYANYRQDGNENLFVQKFIGYDANGNRQRGRSGDTHFPPNGISDYDYKNFTPFDSDITDWKPDGSGVKIPYSAATVRDTPYVFPNNLLPSPRFESHWYIFWRQSMPGFGNTIPYQTSSGSYQMTNWWQFTGDWDRAIRSGVGLYELASCSYTLSSTSQNFSAAAGSGSVTVTAASGCKWFASNNATWTPLVSGDLGNGTGTVNFTVTANTGNAPRTTKIIIAGQTFTVNQASGSPSAVSIAGTVTYGITPTKVVVGVNVNATGASSVSAVTNSTGNYQLSGLGTGAYTVTPTKSGDVNSISSTDASLVARKSANLITLTANQMLAADVSNNGSVSSFDASMIARKAAGLLTNIGVAGQWKFNPLSKNYSGLTSNQTSQNYEAILMGEVSGNWTPPAAPAGNTPSTETAAQSEQEEESSYQFVPDDPVSAPAQSDSSTGTAAAQATINVSLPTNATASSGTVVLIPVTVGDTTGADIFSFDFTVSFNPNVLQPANSAFDLTNTVSGAAGFTITPNTTTAGQLTISGFGTQSALSGAGTLLFLRFNVVGTAGTATGTTDLTFASPAFVFNEGEPQAATTNGAFRVAPATAASVSVGGRAMTSEGKGIRNVSMTMTDSSGNLRTARTSSFGYYRFNDVAAGETYILSATGKRFTFSQPSQVINVVGDADDVNFIGYSR